MALASHSHLVAETTKAEPNSNALGLLKDAAARKTKGTLYLPGIETPFIGVFPVLSNHLLHIDGQTVHHRRFYPFPDTTFERDPEAAYDLFDSAFNLHNTLICRLGRPIISLTAGRDSQATFQAMKPHLRRNSFAWTFLPSKDPDPAIVEDVQRARETAAAAHVQHRVVHLKPTADPAFTEGYSEPTDIRLSTAASPSQFTTSCRMTSCTCSQ